MMKLLRRHILLALILTISSTLTFAQKSGDTYSKAQNLKTANWTFIYFEAPGFATKDTADVWNGVCVDIMAEFRKYLNVKYNIEVTINNAIGIDDFSKFLEEIETSEGGVFGLSSTTITEDRKQDFNFSPPYMTNVGMIISSIYVPTLIEMPNIAERFKGMTAVTVENSTNEKRIQEIKEKYYPDLQIEYVPTFKQAMNEIINHQNKFTNVDFTYYFEAIQNRKPIKRHPGGDEETEQFGIIMPKSNDWAPLLEEFMNSGFLESENYKKIISDNLGESAMKFFETLK